MFYNNDNTNEFLLNLLIKIIKVVILNMNFFNFNLIFDNKFKLLNFDNVVLSWINSKII